MQAPQSPQQQVMQQAPQQQVMQQVPQQQVVYVQQTPMMNAKSSGLAIVLAIIWPGLDFFYLEDTKSGIIRVLLSLFLIWTIIVPFVLWLMGLITSSKRTTEYNNLLVARSQGMAQNQSMIQQ